MLMTVVITTQIMNFWFTLMVILIVDECNPFKILITTNKYTLKHFVVGNL